MIATKKIPVLVLMFFLCYHNSFAQETVKSNRMIDEIKAHNKGMAIWWTGHNG